MSFLRDASFKEIRFDDHAGHVATLHAETITPNFDADKEGSGHEASIQEALGAATL